MLERISLRDEHDLEKESRCCIYCIAYDDTYIHCQTTISQKMHETVLVSLKLESPEAAGVSSVKLSGFRLAQLSVSLSCKL